MQHPALKNFGAPRILGSHYKYEATSSVRKEALSGRFTRQEQRNWVLSPISFEKEGKLACKRTKTNWINRPNRFRSPLYSLKRPGRDSFKWRNEKVSDKITSSNRPSCWTQVMALVSGSPAPLRDVKMVQFGVLSPDEIVSILLRGFQTFLVCLLLAFLS